MDTSKETILSGKEIAVIEKKNKSLISKSNKYEILNQAEADKVNGYLRDLKIALDDMEAKRLKITRPINKGLTELNEMYKNGKAPFLRAIDKYKGAVLDWRSRENERIRLENEAIEREKERRLKIQESHEKRGHETKELEKIPEAVSLKKTDSTKTAKVWKWDISDLSKIKKKYAVALKKDMMEREQKDLKELNKVIREDIKNGVTEVPGFAIYQDEIIRIF